MEALDKYLESLDKKEEPIEKSCCDNPDIYDNEEWNVCVNCGKIVDTLIEREEFKENICFILKTFIPMSYNSAKLVRLHRWINYSYYEVRNDNLTKFIDSLPINDREIITASKYIFVEEFNKVRIRAKVKMGLVCYAIYQAHLILKKPVEINDLFKMLNINEKHYNSAIKKLQDDKIFYPKNIDKYLKMIDNKINKNNLIKSYNLFLEKNTGFNSKTILLSLIYYYLSEEDRKTFYKKFKISSTSINSILKLIKSDVIFN